MKATANLYALRQAQFLNRRIRGAGPGRHQPYADLAQARLAADTAYVDYYNTTLAGGKWQGWQTQTKIGYGDKARYGTNASWADPPQPDQILPAVASASPFPPAPSWASRSTASATGGPTPHTAAVLPTFSRYQTRPAQYIEVFNRGATPFGYQITTPVVATGLTLRRNGD